ncbi:MAG: prolyl oligopeptidase family serine peptidase [Ginsengibacter sp.]
MIRKPLLLLFTTLMWLTATSQINQKYQLPPQSIVELADATFPIVQFSKDGKYMLVLQSPGFESIEQISQPVLGLAGLKVNPANSSLEPETFGSYSSLFIKDLKSGLVHSLKGLSDKIMITSITWNPDNTKFAFANKTFNGIELWLANLSDFSAKKLISEPLNATYGNPIQWHPSGKYLLVETIKKDRGNPPQQSVVPEGPIVQENLGVKTPSRTYQYLLNSPYDEELMNYYLTSQLQQVDMEGNMKSIYKPAIFSTADFSPDGKYLMVQTIERPYSYLVPIYYFPKNTYILDMEGNLVKELFKAPLADKIPIAFDAVAPGPRSYQWRKDAPATLFWVEAQDNGNSKMKTDFHDALYSLSAPFADQPQKVFSIKLRYGGMEWINNEYAIVKENWRSTRTSVMTLINPSTGTVVKEISNRSSENTYADPGRFIKSNDGENEGILLVEKGKSLVVFTTGNGASAQGDRPFIMKWDLLKNKQDTLFKSNAPFYEQPLFFNNTGMVFISRESTETPPNYYSILLKNKKATALTQFADPYPGLKGVQKSLISYPRKDGIRLSGTLYLPKDYKKEDGPLPVLVWAYPREYKTVEAAGQVKGSPYRFPRLALRSPVFWATRGYAVVDNADMPIVGVGKEEPNDSFVEQITDNATSLIDYIVSLGVADRNRIAVGGHSYGAFMTANLLAHTNLFAAGIARSGAYNRTLTPFGFQGEARTFWQAPDTYGKMSPFYYADKIKTPILLIHGIDDDNSGTFPVQSERFYSAIKGFGGTVRLVMLPREFHGYRSRESVLHTFWEQDQWLEKYVKNKK